MPPFQTTMQSLVASVIRGSAEWVVRQNDRRPYVQARLNGTVIDLLFDTGASISCLKADIWKMIKENCDPSEYVERLPSVPAVGANGKSLNILQEVKLTLDLAGQRRSQWFYVVADLPVSGLIGVDIIQAFGITYDPSHCRLMGPNESLVRVSHSHTIDPNDVSLVEVEFYPSVNSVQHENRLKLIKFLIPYLNFPAKEIITNWIKELLALAAALPIGKLSCFGTCLSLHCHCF